MNWPRKGYGVQSWEIHVWLVGCRAPCLGLQDFVTFVGEGFPEEYDVGLFSRVSPDGAGLGTLLGYCLQGGEKCSLAVYGSICEQGTFFQNGWGCYAIRV